MSYGCQEIEIICINKKTKGRTVEVVYIEIKEYIDCYSDEEFHLSEYPEYNVKKELERLKKEFVEEKIRAQFHDKSIKLEYDIDFIIQDLDETVKEIKDGADIYPNER